MTINDPVPTELGGRYRIGRLLGRGGMAEVHIASDNRLGREVAVKVLRPDLARDPVAQVRFRREAHSAASLNHPSVVAVYDTGEDQVDGNPVPYIIMEYVDGRTLREFLATGARLLPERAYEIIDGVLAALSYSHAAGIIHRDIKPANVMLTRSGDVKVMDFGIARSTDDVSAGLTQTSQVMGTAQYFSPEQAQGHTADARSDLYSAGCLLYELLTGRPPFSGDTQVNLALMHIRNTPVAPTEIDHDLPASADAIVAKAMAKDPAERYQNAAQMRRDIAAARAGRPVSAVVAVPVVAPASAAATEVLPGFSRSNDPATAYQPRTGPATVTRRAERRAERQGQGGRALAYALLGLAVVAVFVIAAVIANSLLGGSGTTQVAVPPLRGLTVQQANRQLTQAGLKLGEQTESNNDTMSQGSIIDQSVPAGTQVDKGRIINVVVSLGVKETVVPRIAGLPIDQAIQLLRDAKLVVGNRTPVPSPDDADTVLRTSPKAEQKVAEGSAVDITYASGNNKVPDVTGKDENNARNILEQAGFQVPASQTQESADEPPGSVLSQSLPPGSTLRLGSTIVLTVATAPPSPSVTPLPTDSITPPVESIPPSP